MKPGCIIIKYILCAAESFAMRRTLSLKLKRKRPEKAFAIAVSVGTKLCYSKHQSFYLTEKNKL